MVSQLLEMAKVLVCPVIICSWGAVDDDDDDDGDGKGMVGNDRVGCL